ncbi:3-phosphoshikimate 1-carboxyvinyltransferase [Flavobacterium pallidum]|uniref:3-phosphoshikimate 1-carboxyvinyltransferase n=1 Tax=Flavobacterium pallidum TaxID=2172098 RepID=A0A2S1SGP6_9FLAO|nr:3-phosphoshikimate 1-carboxyvinyltransferase [Flavobacterium pallidum]AWI25522.1 3-phosphoshikimate 1-carboxyvinyltransferase [Flavobacterium pallidum]
MDIQLRPQVIFDGLHFKITGSKSETNRLLLLQAIFPEIQLQNISASDDAEVMAKALSASDRIIDVHHAGTAMRFLTAFFAAKEGSEVEITGSPRMKERPIRILVDALKSLGAEIEYQETEGFPPLLIKGKKLTGSKVSLQGNVSSQYISALLLIAPKLESGLELELLGELTSIPYIKMTLSLLEKIGVKTTLIGNSMMVAPKPRSLSPEHVTLTIESDWSSASYFYSIIALASAGTSVTLSSYRQNSLQGDSALAEIYSPLGVDTIYSNNMITLKKRKCDPKPLLLNLSNTPDIAQTLAVTCFGLGIPCALTGLHTLKIKETDRLQALKNELEKLGAAVSITNNSLQFPASAEINQNIAIETYNDHRMAMAFAPLSIKIPIIIKDAGVVSKSYPGFWDDFERIGLNVIRS